jgi:hypothetical protein
MLCYQTLTSISTSFTCVIVLNINVDVGVKTVNCVNTKEKS